MCFPAVRNILHRSAILLLTKEVWKKLYVCLLIMKLKGKKNYRCSHCGTVELNPTNIHEDAAYS